MTLCSARESHCKSKAEYTEVGEEGKVCSFLLLPSVELHFFYPLPPPHSSLALHKAINPPGCSNPFLGSEMAAGEGRLWKRFVTVCTVHWLITGSRLSSFTEVSCTEVQLQSRESTPRGHLGSEKWCRVEAGVSSPPMPSSPAQLGLCALLKKNPHSLCVLVGKTNLTKMCNM